MSADSCELTIKFAPMPRARRAARRNAIDILAEYLLKLEAEEAERARAGDEPAPNALEVTGTNGDVELDNHRIQQIAEPVCF